MYLLYFAIDHYAQFFICVSHLEALVESKTQKFRTRKEGYSLAGDGVLYPLTGSPGSAGGESPPSI